VLLRLLRSWVVGVVVVAGDPAVAVVVVIVVPAVVVVEVWDPVVVGVVDGVCRVGLAV
jgi:hypothetical protein